MRKQKNKLTEAENLRQKAEKIYREKASKVNTVPNESDIFKLYHELSVHQIELEIQNSELIRVKEDLEAAYSDLYDFAPAGYLTLSKGGQIIRLNLSASTMIGKERSHLINSVFSSLITDDSKQTLNHFLKAIFNNNASQSCEVALFKKSKPHMYVYLVGVISKDGRSCDISMIDISERKDAERKMNDLINRLTTSNRELEEFAYVASHDLQEPLRMVTSFMQLLSMKYKDKLDDDAAEYIHYAVDGAKRMYDLLNALLAYSRIKTKGKAFMAVNTNNVLTCVLKNLSLKIEETSAIIKVDELPVLNADEVQMTQLFQNLIGNCLKFSTGTPHIYVSSKSNTDHYTFSIKDEGIGIESQYFERIFRIFQRLTPNEYDGTGVGLAICKRIVERHGGNIWVESKIGMGSTFFFTIPK